MLSIRTMLDKPIAKRTMILTPFREWKTEQNPFQKTSPKTASYARRIL